MPVAFRTPCSFQPRWISDQKIPANSRLRVHGRQKGRDRGRDTVDGVGSGRIRTVDSVSRVDARSGSGSGHGGRGSDKVMAEPGTRIPRWMMKVDQGSGHGGRGPDGRLRRPGRGGSGDGWRTPRARSGWTRPGYGADPASGHGAPHMEAGALGGADSVDRRRSRSENRRDRRVQRRSPSSTYGSISGVGPPTFGALAALV